VTYLQQFDDPLDHLINRLASGVQYDGAGRGP
jgi:hypothetical protein